MTYIKYDEYSSRITENTEKKIYMEILQDNFFIKRDVFHYNQNSYFFSHFVISKNGFEYRKIEEHHRQSWDGGGSGGWEGGREDGGGGGGIGAKGCGGGSRKAGMEGGWGVGVGAATTDVKGWH